MQSVRKESLITMGGKHEAKCSRGACDWVVGQVSEVFERTFVLLLAARPHLCRARAWAVAGRSMIHIAAHRPRTVGNRIFLLTMPLPLGPGQDMSATKLLPHAGRQHPSTFGGVASPERRSSTKWQQKGTSESGEPSIWVRGGIGLDREGSTRSRAAHQTPCRLHVPAHLVHTRM